MADRVQKIREEVERIQLYTQSEVLKQVLDYIDEVQKEEIPPKLPLISQKKCMYTKDHYTDEDRKVLCEDCKEKCEYSKKKEPVSEDLGEYINKLSKQFPEVSFAKLSRIAVMVAKWQKEQFEKDYTNLCKGIATAKGIAVKMAYDKGMDDAKEQMMAHLWKSADGDDLPDVGREVIALAGLEGFFEIPPDEPVKLSYKVVFAHRPPEYWDGKDIVTGKVTRNYPKTYDKGGWNIPNVKYWLDCQIPNMGED